MSSEQQNLIDEIQTFERGFFGITGPAGTGKTYAVCAAIDPSSALFLGATNKVVNVLRKGLAKNGHEDAKVRTIDSVLGFKIVKDEENNSRVTYKKFGPKYWASIPRTIVVDEISLISNEKFDKLMELCVGRKVILIGDDMQIPPIEDRGNEIRSDKGFKISKAFTVFDKHVELTEQHRQAKDSKLFDLISKYREFMGRGSYASNLNLTNIAAQASNGNDVLFIPNIKSQEFNEILQNDDTIAVTYKNMTSMTLSWIMGAVKYKNPRFKLNVIEVGEKVWFDSFYKHDTVSFYTTDLVEVLSIDQDAKGTIEFNGFMVDYPFTQMRVKDEMEREYDIRVSHGKSTYGKVWYRKKTLLEKIGGALWGSKHEADHGGPVSGTILAKMSKSEKSAANTKYFDFMTSFAKLKKPLAITSHKSQGSTFDQVIIPINDFQHSSQFHDAQQLIYTAMSRAKSRLIFVDLRTLYKKAGSALHLTEDEKCAVASNNGWTCPDCGREVQDTRELRFSKKWGDVVMICKNH